MELYEEIIAKILAQNGAKALLPELDIGNIVMNECYRALNMIKAVLEDDSLADKDCFQRIEEIVTIYESLGSDAGNRHDFG